VRARKKNVRISNRKEGLYPKKKNGGKRKAHQEAGGRRERIYPLLRNRRHLLFSLAGEGNRRWIRGGFARMNILVLTKRDASELPLLQEGEGRSEPEVQ